MADPLNPNVGLLVKLGSLAVHADELTDYGLSAVRGHEHDKETIKSLLSDPEVADWLKQMQKLAFLPVKR